MIWFFCIRIFFSPSCLKHSEVLSAFPHFESSHSSTQSSSWDKNKRNSTYTVVSPYCHLLVVSTQVFCWQVICAVLCQVMDLLVLMWITTGSWLLTTLFLSVMFLLINTCYYFDLCFVLWCFHMQIFPWVLHSEQSIFLLKFLWMNALDHLSGSDFHCLLFCSIHLPCSHFL